MCGIAGIARFDGPTTPADVEGVLRMLDAQLHRGPNDWGILVPDYALRIPEVRGLLERRGLDHVRTYPAAGSVPGAVLGSRRLSIIDLSPRGRMPMGTAGGRTWITYNGEVYNARELRAELTRLGYAFDSDSDTEAILHGYEAWGDDVVHHLRGMFAFAVLDLRAGPRLLLARDRFGIKPVYYHQAPGRVVFASEVRALARSGAVPRERNAVAEARFLQLGSVPQPLTTIKDVFAVPAGHRLVAERGGATLSRYWDLAASVTHPSDDVCSVTYADAIRPLLDDAVKSHLVSDVPLGVFLSGGLDSSALVAMASRLSDAQVTTVSIVFDDPAFDESAYARLVARRWNTRHHEVRLGSKDLYDDLPAIFGAMDQPSVDGVNTYFVSKAAARAGLTVVLAGTGADELFLGYDHFRRARRFDRHLRVFGRLPGWVRAGMVRAAAPVAHATGRSGLDRLAYLAHGGEEDAYLLFRGLFPPRQVCSLLGLGAPDLAALRSGNGGAAGAGRSLVDAFVVMEFAHYLNDQLLKDTDIMSMAHSIETRVPYLDHRLVERVAALPSRVKLGDGVNKPVLVDAVREDVPREVWDRPKMGFTFPFAQWLKERASELEAASQRTGLLDRAETSRVWEGFTQGRVHWSRAWALAVLGSWDRHRTDGVAA